MTMQMLRRIPKAAYNRPILSMAPANAALLLNSRRGAGAFANGMRRVGGGISCSRTRAEGSLVVMPQQQRRQFGDSLRNRVRLAPTVVTGPNLVAHAVEASSSTIASRMGAMKKAGPSPPPPHGQHHASSNSTTYAHRALDWYLRLCRARPLLAVASTSFVLWGLGDVTAQCLERWLALARLSNSAKTNTTNATAANPAAPLPLDNGLDLRRLWATVMFGTVVGGGMGHFWYRFLDHVVLHRLRLVEGTAKFIVAKLALECALWHPVGLSAFWAVQGVYAEGKSMATVRNELKTDLLPALAVEVGMWTPIDIINFRYTPVHLQVIVVNFVSFFEAIVLSYLHSEILAQPSID